MRNPIVGVNEVQRWFNRYMDLAGRNLGAFRQAQEDVRNRVYSPTALISDAFYVALNSAEAAYVPFESVRPVLNLLTHRDTDEVSGAVDFVIPPLGAPTPTALDPGGAIPAANVNVAMNGATLQVRIQGLQGLGLAPGTFTGRITDGPPGNPLSAWDIPVTLRIY